MRGPCFWWLKSRRRRSDGFAAIEFALVVAGTSIVIALGFSIYRTYSVRAQIAATIEEISATQRLVVAAFQNSGAPPFDAAATGIDDTAYRLLAGSYVESLEISNGRIDLRFGMGADPAIAGRTLSLMPFETVGQDIVWICGNESPGVGLKPLGFGDGGPQPVPVTTPIKNRYLPSSCR